MWRRLCVDVDHAGKLLGASIEHYTEEASPARVVEVMSPRWTDSRSCYDAFHDLLVWDEGQGTLWYEVFMEEDEPAF